MANLMNTVKERATEQLDNQKSRATDGLSAITGAVRQTTQQLRNDHHEGLAQYVDRAADQLERFSNAIREKDAEELLGDARKFARKQPAIFIGGSFVVGLLAARFFKSSRQSDDGMYDESGYGAGASRATDYPVRDRVADDMQTWSRDAGTPGQERF